MLHLSSGLLFLFGVGNGDTYMQNPRGSNNRLNEKSANRNNGNRLFDSQNNNRGGYNVGETGVAGQNFAQDSGTQFGEGTAAQMYDPSDTSPNGNSYQYDMLYQAGSQMRMTWTSQHGCGNAMNNCNMVIQFGCDDNDNDATDQGDQADFASFTNTGIGTRMTLHNGRNTNQPQEPGANTGNAAGTFATNNNNNGGNGRHESEEYYAMCRLRTRNKGLFTADQKLKGNSQIYTRQNPNGQRRGLECPEERDYFPWEFPSPWRDIAWVGQDVEYCKTKIAPESMNVKAKGTCTGGDADTLPNEAQAAAMTLDECEAVNVGGTWVETSWGKTFSEAWASQFCQQAEWTQVNHLGNVDGSSLGGQMASFMWTIPTMAELVDDYGCKKYEMTVDGNKVEYVRMVTRNRYNISTGDYDPYQTGSDQNNDPKNGVISPVTQNPTVDVGAYMQGLRLALNTAQTGRTFQDRSHVFNVYNGAPQTAGSTFPAAQRTQAMLNVNVRGKRGNIVQTFPAMEYDFEPNDFTIAQDQCVHFQWTGSNTHNNGNPAGDGQAGDAGEGAGGTDRSNIMEVKSLRTSYPLAYDQDGVQSFFDEVKCKYPLEGSDWLTSAQSKAIFASAGYYYANGATTLGNMNVGNQINNLLNNVSASFRQGLVCCTDGTTKAGDYYFISTRNNNFTNRSQKMHIKVITGLAGAGQKTARQFQYYQGMSQ